MEANRNELLAGLEARLNAAQLPAAARHVVLGSFRVQARERIRDLLGRMPGQSVAVGVGSITAGIVAEEAVRQLIRAVIAQAAREGGEALVKQTAVLAECLGLLALKAVQGAPAAVVKAVNSIPAELAEQGLRAVVRESAVMQGMVRESGGVALETAARHPGLAGKISAGMGRECLEMASKLSTQEATLLVRYADDVTKLPAAERVSVMGLIKPSPGWSGIRKSCSPAPPPRPWCWPARNSLAKAASRASSNGPAARSTRHSKPRSISSSPR
jgi:hypothetical protein